MWTMKIELEKMDLIYKALGGTSLVVQWLRLCTPNAGGRDSIPGWGTKILHIAQGGRKKLKL